jgi:hypothetical protein
MQMGSVSNIIDQRVVYVVKVKKMLELINKSNVHKGFDVI